MNCKNCNNEVHENYCPKCGQPSTLKRIDSHYIVHEIEHLFHFERGMLFTIRALLTSPGESVRQFITDNRLKLVKPITFIIVTSLIYSVVSHFFHIDEFFIKFDTKNGVEKKAFFKILDWLKSNYGYLNILSGALTSIWLKIFFKKYGYNFFEILVLLCYVTGATMLIYAFFAVIEGVIHFKLSGIARLIGGIYLVVATGNFFEKKKLLNYTKALICYLLGMIAFVIIFFGLGLVVDFLTH
jgi:hypothetical protein